jgi:tRNA U38,U39,U40 pseudouridine synthase TruA
MCPCRQLQTTEAGDATVDSVRERINSHLPPDISILDVIRTSRNFCAKTQHNKVRYQYMLPTYVLMEQSKLRQVLLEQAGRESRQARSQCQRSVNRRQSISATTRIVQVSAVNTAATAFQRHVAAICGHQVISQFHEGRVQHRSECKTIRHVV